MTDPRPVANALSSPALAHLGAVSKAYAELADDYKGLAHKAAEAEAAYKNERAKLVLKVRASGEVKSQAEADAHADGNERICELLTKRLLTRAAADSAKEKLRSLAAQNENGRTFAATEREIDRLHAQGRGGAA